MHQPSPKLFVLLGVLGGMGLTACGEKKVEESLDTGKPKEVAVREAVVEPAKAAPVPAGDALEKRAAALGFAKYLPKTTHGYMGIFDGKGFVGSLRGSKLGKLLEERGAEEGIDLGDLEENPQAGMVLSLFAEEFFVAVGEGAPEQCENLVAFSESSTMLQLKSLVKMLEMQLTGKEPEDGMMGMGPAEMMAMSPLGGLLHDPAAGLALLEKMRMPPLTIGFKISDADTREQLAGMAKDGIGQMLAEAGPDGEDIMEAVTIKRGDSTFSGVKIIGKKIAAKIGEDEREGLAQMMDAASIEKLIKLLEAKNIVLAVGVHGDYLVGYAGTDAEGLQIAASPKESVVARGELAFMDHYAGKKLLAVVAMSKEVQDGLTKNATLLGSVAKGVKAGLAETEGFGDTRDLEVLLDLVVKQEAGIIGMNRYTPAGLVAYREKGLKIETYGGSNMPDADLGAVHQYGNLAKEDGIFIFANWVENEEYSAKALEYLDTVGETLYLGAKQVTTLDIEDGDFDQFKEGFGLFDQKIRPHLLELWGALRGDLAGGLGAEGALIVDLKGGLPTVPGLPQVVVDKGKAPRIGIIAPVKDREKIGASWKRIDKAAQGLLKVVSELSENNIPMQKPMSSEKNDLKTWFFPFPFQTDDFVLSASADKKNFFLATSKSFVQDLSASLEKNAPDPARKGAWLEVDLTELNAYLNDWIKLVEAHAGEILGEDSPDLEDLRENLPLLKEIVAASAELKGITAHTRKEGGTIRSSIHFATGE